VAVRSEIQDDHAKKPSRDEAVLDVADHFTSEINVHVLSHGFASST